MKTTSEATGAATTSNGYRVCGAHPMAAQGYQYRRTVVSGVVHVDEYVAPMGVWVHLGTL